MKNGFFANRSLLGIPNALFLLMIIFFLVPFAARGARMALQKTENNVKDWLPSDFRETEELNWFAKHFVSEQFVVATWEGCTEDSQRLRMFVSKLKSEMAPSSEELQEEWILARATLRDYALFVDDSDHLNWGGLREKWLVDESGGYFYVTPNGRLYRWQGGANIISALGRAMQRAIGSFKLEGQFVAALGTPGSESKPNPFWQDPRLIASPLIKTVETGPNLVQQLAGPGKPLFVESNPVAGERMAKARLTGTLFGPPVPTDFGWRSNDLAEILPETTLAQMPEGWQAIWDQVVQNAAESLYGGDLERLRKADPVNQAEVWYDFFDRIGVDEPPRQTCIMMTLTEPARRNLGRVLGRGVLGQPTGRLFQIAGECGVSPPPKPNMAPPPFHLLADSEPVAEPVIRVGGPPVDNVAIDEEGTITLVRLIGYSLALGLFLSYFLLRSIRLTAITFFVGGVSAMASLGMVWWGRASVDAILLTMPSLVYVLGMAGAIHIINYYRDAIEEEGLENAPDRAIHHAFLPCTLAAITTAIGLFSLCSSNILPIRKFGIFSAIGVVGTLGLLFLFVPSALTIFPPKVRSTSIAGQQLTAALAKFWDVVAQWIIRRHWLVNAGFGLLLIGMGVGLFKIKTSVQLLKLFDGGSQIIQDYTWLEDNFGRLVPMELVVRFPESIQAPAGDTSHLTSEQRRQARTQLTLLERVEAVQRIQQVLQNEFGYEGSNVVGRGMSTVTFLRGLPEPSSTYNPMRGGANNVLQSKRDELLRSEYMALETSPLNKDAELWRISLRLGALNDVDYGQFVGSLRKAVEPIVAAYRCRKAVMDAVVSQESEQIKGRVLILGTSKPTNNGGSKSSDPRPESGSNLPEESLVLAETLATCLVNNSINRVYWHDPQHNGDGAEAEASREKFAESISKFDCVVLLQADPKYDIESIRANAANFVDASKMLSEIRKFNQNSASAATTAIEQSTHTGEVDVVYTGIIPVVYKAQRTLLESLIESVAWAFVLIFVVMAFLLSPATSLAGSLSFRNLLVGIGCGSISMIPNVFPVIFIFGFMGHAGTLVDIGTMMTASVAMGVAVDDTIHFLTWFRRNMREGMDRHSAILATYRRVAPAMTQTTIIGGLGLSVFALSTFTPTQRFGTLMLTLLLAALAGDLIFLPALLASPLGRFFHVRRNKAATSSDDPGSGEEPPTDSEELRLLEDVRQPANRSTSIETEHTAGSDDRSQVPIPKMLKSSAQTVRKRS
jgi:uncharacterized protein